MAQKARTRPSWKRDTRCKFKDDVKRGALTLWYLQRGSGTFFEKKTVIPRITTEVDQ